MKLMRSCREIEMKFLVRTLVIFYPFPFFFCILLFSLQLDHLHYFQVRNLRIGAMMRTILPALAQAIVMNSSSNFHFKDTAEKLQKMQVFIPYILIPFLSLKRLMLASMRLLN